MAQSRPCIFVCRRERLHRYPWRLRRSIVPSCSSNTHPTLLVWSSCFHAPTTKQEKVKLFEFRMRLLVGPYVSKFVVVLAKNHFVASFQAISMISASDLSIVLNNLSFRGLPNISYDPWVGPSGLNQIRVMWYPPKWVVQILPDTLGGTQMGSE